MYGTSKCYQEEDYAGLHHVNLTSIRGSRMPPVGLSFEIIDPKSISGDKKKDPAECSARSFPEG